MNTFDVRNSKEVKVDRIRFADEDFNLDLVNSIELSPEGDIVLHYDFDYEDCNVVIANCDVPNFLKALDKAKELGWFSAEKKPAAKKAIAKKAAAKATGEKK